MNKIRIISQSSVPWAKKNVYIDQINNAMRFMNEDDTYPTFKHYFKNFPINVEELISNEIQKNREIFNENPNMVDYLSREEEKGVDRILMNDEIQIMPRNRVETDNR